MILKDFSAQVADDHRALFHEQQLRWEALSPEPGFIAQCGGWDANSDQNPASVQIFGFWADDDAYANFRDQIHDPICATGSQERTYTKGHGQAHRQIGTMPGIVSNLAAALVHNPALIRVARCIVRPDRVDHFLDVQESIWKPGMNQAQGMLGGSYWQSLNDPNAYIVTTAWATQADHHQYTVGHLPDLRTAAEQDKDLESLVGQQIILDANWTVLPS